MSSDEDKRDEGAPRAASPPAPRAPEPERRPFELPLVDGRGGDGPGLEGPGHGAMADERAREAMAVLRSRERGAAMMSTPSRTGDEGGVAADASFPPPEWTRSGGSEATDALPFPEPADDGEGFELDTEPLPDRDPELAPIAAVPVDPDAPEFETIDDPRIPPGQELFRIGEVARAVGVEAHVLRYWETVFPAVEPAKTSSNQRRYRRADVARLLQIKRLRHDTGLTVAQARAYLEEAARLGRRPPDPPVPGLGLAARSEPDEARPIIGRAEDESRLRGLRGRLSEMRALALELLEAVDD